MDTKQNCRGCSAIIYRKEDDKVFIAQRKLNKSFGGGLWETIGGSLEQYDKSFEDCIKREVQEELLVDVDIIKEFKDYSTTNEKGNTFMIKTFLVTLKSKPIPNQADFEEWGWFNKGEIEELDFVSNCKERLLEYYSG